MDTQFAFRIDRDTLTKLHEMAAEQDRTLAQVMRRMIKAYMAEVEARSKDEKGEA